MAQRAEVTFLHSIFRVGRISKKVSRQRVDVVEIGQRGIAKTSRFFIIITARVSRHHVVPSFQGSANLRRSGSLGLWRGAASGRRFNHDGSRHVWMQRAKIFICARRREREREFIFCVERC
jgi:hypothetical protein